MGGRVERTRVDGMKFWDGDVAVTSRGRAPCAMALVVGISRAYFFRPIHWPDEGLWLYASTISRYPGAAFHTVARMPISDFRLRLHPVFESRALPPGRRSL